MALHDVESPILKSECRLESFTQSSKLDTQLTPLITNSYSYSSEFRASDHGPFPALFEPIQK